MKTQRHYYKPQTVWVRYPARIEAHRGDMTVAVRIHPERRAVDPPQDGATIFLTAHEAQAFASWLSAQADEVLAKQARAAARKAARLAKKMESQQ